MAGIKTKLLGAEYLELFATEVRKLMAEEARGEVTEADTRRARLARLNVEIERYADAVADGAGKTVLERLKAAERERSATRAQRIGAPLEIEGPEKGGTSVRVCLPLAKTKK